MLLKEQRLVQLSKGIYFEKHHIKMRCMDGPNDESNLVYLTAREHFIAHRLIYMEGLKTHCKDMIVSFIAMGMQNQITSRQFEVVRKANSKRMKIYWSDPHVKAERSYAHSKCLLDKWKDPEYREKLESIHKHRCRNPKVRKFNSDISKTMWKDPKLRKHHAKVRQLYIYTVTEPNGKINNDCVVLEYCDKYNLPRLDFRTKNKEILSDGSEKLTPIRGKWKGFIITRKRIIYND